jgi:hypothetical protein
MNRSLLALAVTCTIALASPRARAAGESPGTDNAASAAQCSVALLPDPHKTDFPLLYQPRHDELTLEVGYLASSFPFESALETTLMYSFAPLDEVWHFGLRAGMNAGRWGSDERGPVGLALGARVAVDLRRPLNGLLAVYIFAQADTILLASDGDAVLRPAFGVGVRAARAIGLEVNGNTVIALGDPFANGDRVAGGFGVTLNFDLCVLGSFCDETPPKQTTVDLTSQLYQAAANVATRVQNNPTQHKDLCAAVDAALDASHHPSSDPGDSTGPFLQGLVTGVTDPALKSALSTLAQLHANLREQLVNPTSGTRIQSRLAAQKGHVLVDDCVYSPFPVELRAQLGCEPPSPASP